MVRLTLAVAVSDAKSILRPIMSKVTHELTLSPVLFKNFLNDLDNGVVCTLSMFIEDTKLRGVADVPKNCAATQRDLVSLEMDQQLPYEIQWEA